MTTLSQRIAPRESVMTELSVVWLVATVAFTYLEVPLQHSALFAINLILQASLGGFVITRLVKGVVPSLLLLCGPGLILGGALSFAIFQAVGRGAIGVMAQSTAAITALLGLLMGSPSYSGTLRPVSLGVHALGLTALAISTEFKWLLVVAAASLLVAYLLDSRFMETMTSKWLVAVIFVGILVVASTFRGAYWWLITDDYKFFEVLSRHLTKAGPLADWGSLDVSRYHWLSYGWAGLLDISAGASDTLGTLTKVMPFVYSLALAASLMLISQQLLPRPTYAHRFIQTLPAWVLTAGIRLDWAAPSTAGAVAVLASTIAVTLLIVECRATAWSRICLYALSALTMTFTKLPSALTLPAIFLSSEIILARKQRLVSNLWLSPLTAVSAVSLVGILLLNPLSDLLGDFTVQWTPLQGESPKSGLPFSLAAPLTQHLWIGVLIVVAWILTYRTRRTRDLCNAEMLLISFTPLFFVGLITNAVIPNSAKSNVHEYFSTPHYFLAALSVLLVPARLPRNVGRVGWRTIGTCCSAIFVVVICAQLVAEWFGLPYLFNDSTVFDALGDGRTVVGIAVVVALLIRRFRAYFPPLILVVILLTQSLITARFATFVSLIDNGFRQTLPATEVVSYLGSVASRDVGIWLRNNTDENELVATNSLFLEPRSGIYGDDYSLAMWSQREFLVLGPKFFGAAESAAEEIALSIRFGSEPTATDASILRQRGVRWFVVDTAETDRSTWEPFATVAFRNHRFVVLKMLDEL